MGNSTRTRTKVPGGNGGICGAGHTRLKSVTVPSANRWKRCAYLAVSAIAGRLQNREPTPTAPRPLRKARRLGVLGNADCVFGFKGDLRHVTPWARFWVTSLNWSLIFFLSFGFLVLICRGPLRALDTRVLA